MSSRTTATSPAATTFLPGGAIITGPTGGPTSTALGASPGSCTSNPNRPSISTTPGSTTGNKNLAALVLAASAPDRVRGDCLALLERLTGWPQCGIIKARTEERNMALVQYIAEVKDGLLLELPTEAEELHLKPGDKVEVRLVPPVERQKTDKNNKPVAKPEAAGKPKQLRGRGMLAGILSSEEFMRRKQEDIELEDRPLR